MIKAWVLVIWMSPDLQIHLLRVVALCWCQIFSQHCCSSYSWSLFCCTVCYSRSNFPFKLNKYWNTEQLRGRITWNSCLTIKLIIIDELKSSVFLSPRWHPDHPDPRHPVENWRTFWWTWDSRVAGPWRRLISRVSLASAKYLIYTAPTQFVY